MAYALGDPTAKRAGRLTLNPFKHLDPVGFLCLALLRFGWAKPVPVNPTYFKRRKLGMALTALAGPVMNILLATISMAAMYALILYAPVTNVTEILYTILYLCVVINIGLAVFNLIPLPPLDGSRLLMPVLPRKVQSFLYKNERYVHMALVALIVTGVLTGPLGIARSWVFNGIEAVVRWIML